MTTLSNTYIEKVNSEHPLAVWMLNEDVDYLSSITETTREIYDTSDWEIINGTKSQELVKPLNTPFLDSALSRISGSVPTTSTMDITLRSYLLIPAENFTEELANFAISFFLYVDNPYANSISFGYQYTDSSGIVTTEVLETRPLSSLDSGSWLFFSSTYELPPEGSINVKYLFKMNVSIGGSIGDYDFLINGLTTGQWSEEFNKTSLGVNPIALPTNIALPVDPTAGVPTCVPALPYGASTLNAYYLAHDYRLYASNFGIPLVYGSSNVTKVYAHEHSGTVYPALIFPGYGFLNEKGKFNEYTAEMWIKVNTDAQSPRKIFGPITGNDGIYVEGGFLTFVIGKHYGSHYVGEWYRPMLIHIRFIKNNITVLLNGEEIISIDLIESELDLPTEYDESDDSQDWLGFYAYPDVKPLEIDSFAIYSYSVPVEVAKRRWVWGQGVVAPEITNSSLNATTAFNDYSFANYAVNYNYPDFASWKQAFFSNVETSSNFLQLPEYSLPDLFLDNYKTQAEWLDDLSNIVLETTTRTNLVANPSMESSLSGWSAQRMSLSTETTNVFVGTKALKGTVNSTVGIQYIDLATFPTVIPGTTYRASAYVFMPLTNSSDRSVRLELHPVGTGFGVRVDGNTSFSIPRGQWVRINAIGTMPATVGGTPTTGVLLRVIPTTTLALSDVMIVDAYLVEQSSTLGSYFDGGYNQLDAKYNPVTAWTGTANLSTSTLTYLSSESDANGDKFFTFRPNSGWSNKDCYAFFENFGVLADPVESFYMVAESNGTSVNETLLKIINNITQDYLTVSLNSTTLTYTLNISGTSSTLATKTISANQKFTVGMNLSTLSLRSINGINQFFSNESLLSAYVGGDGTTTFKGKIYRVGFDAVYNNKKINSYYDSTGIFNINLATANDLFSHTANYTMKVYDKYGFYFLDIASAGYWEDYMPLSYFGKYVKNYEGDSLYDLDSIQINLDYPEPLETSARESVSSWTYADLTSRYAVPVQLTYEELSNNFFTGWDDYEDMSQDSEKYYYYETENNTIRSYISFQKILNGANTKLVDFPNKSVPRIKGVVDPDLLVDINQDGEESSGNWENTAYEVVDGTVIYPPTVDSNNNIIDFNNLAIVYHLDFITEGIFHNPVKFRDLQLASQVLERKQFTEIGTRFGVPIYPYSKTGLYYNFKGKNPISTYKGSTPYLYLNRHSGWRLRGGFSPMLDRGLSIPINTQRGLETEVSALQLWVRFSELSFPTEELEIFSIEHKDGIYDFYIKSDESSQRGYIFARDRSTDEILSNIEYTINGRSVDTIYLVNEEWSVLGIAFTELLSFDQYTGRLNLNGPLTYNNISYYLATNLEQDQRVEVRSWSEVKDDGVSRTWDYWENSFTWSQVKIISTINQYSIDPGAIYEKYVGTNRTIVDDGVDGVLFNPDILKIYGDVEWTTSIQIPV